jgi:starvation-inducible DNA-binding protein
LTTRRAVARPPTMPSLKMYLTDNDNSKDRQVEMNELLNRRLAAAVDLHLQLKQANWNVKDPSFSGLPELFGKVARSVESYVDMIAGRIVVLGGVAKGTLRDAAKCSILVEPSLKNADSPAQPAAVVLALATFGRDARHTITDATKLGDTVTADLFREIARGISQWLAYIEAHTQGPKQRDSL